MWWYPEIDVNVEILTPTKKRNFVSIELYKPRDDHPGIPMFYFDADKTELVLKLADIIHEHHLYSYHPLATKGTRKKFMVSDYGYDHLQLVFTLLEKVGAKVAKKVARLHDCQTGWWWMKYKKHKRPDDVLEAIRLIYG